MKKTLTILAAMVVLMAVGTVQADYSVDYTAELNKDGNCIKFEDAMYLVEIIEEPYEEIWVDAGLGDYGLVETDTFAVTVDGAVTEIEVTVKAGRGKDSQESAVIELDGVDEFVMILGFKIELIEIDGDTYILAVTSDDNNATAALSNITFCFDAAVVAPDPEDGPVTVDRVSDVDAAGEPEEVEIEEPEAPDPD